MRGIARLVACSSLVFSLAVLPIGSRASTKVVVYRPAGMDVTATYAGRCSSPSQLSAQAHAVRCSAHLHGTYDPCFADGPGRAACPIDVARNRGIVVTVDKLPDPKPSRTGPSRPWAMRLSQGQFCIYAAHYSGQHGYPYSCGASVCAAPTLAPLNTTYEANCVPIAGHGHKPRPFFVATIWD
jgi:hypothetical protein